MSATRLNGPPGSRKPGGGKSLFPLPRFVLLLTTVFGALANACTSSDVSSGNEPYQDFTGPALELRYREPAEYFEETVLLGNGRVGPALFGGVTRERIYLNDATLWAGGPVDPHMAPEAYTHLPEVDI